MKTLEETICFITARMEEHSDEIKRIKEIKYRTNNDNLDGIEISARADECVKILRFFLDKEQAVQS